MKALHVLYRMSRENSGAAGLIMQAIQDWTDTDAVPFVHMPCGVHDEIVLPGGPAVEKKMSRRRLGNRLLKALHPRRVRNLPINIDWFGLDCASAINAQQTDIVHLHWIADARVSLRALQTIRAPLVWTMHDIWPLTGGCHCNLGCEHWLSGCRDCPQLGSGIASFSASHLSWESKKSWYAAIPDFYPVSPSRWLGDMARKSPLFAGREVHVIPNCVDTTVFRPANKNMIRREIGIAENAKVIAFGAVDVDSPYKGAELLVETLHILAQRETTPYHLLVFGANKSQRSFGVPYPVTSLGLLECKDDVARALQAADVFLGPSRQDNFPTIYLEASACGVPCAGFAVGGIPEIARHKETGYVAAPFDCRELAQGVAWLLKSPERLAETSEKARAMAVAEYSMPVCGKNYASFYERIVREQRHRQ
jgi:glycosyltransferase involved in cell wall biosynthesis